MSVSSFLRAVSRPFRSTEVRIPSPLAPDALLSKIREGVDDKGFSLFAPWGSGADKPLVAKVQGRRLQLQKRIGYRNSFVPLFRGEVVPGEAGGALVRGEIGMHPVVVAFLSVWIALAGLGSAVICVAMLSSDERSIFAFAPLAMPFFGLLLAHLGCWLARGDGPYVVDYLRRCAGDGPATRP
jgi:hypothetical protein